MIIQFPYEKCKYINQNILLENPIDTLENIDVTEESNLQDFIKNINLDLLNKPPLPFDDLRKYTAVTSTSYIYANDQFYFGGKQIDNPFNGDDQIINWFNKFTKDVFNVLIVASVENGKSSMDIILYNVEGKLIDNQTILLE